MIFLYKNDIFQETTNSVGFITPTQIENELISEKTYISKEPIINEIHTAADSNKNETCA